MTPDLTWYKLLAVGLVGGVAGVAVDVTDIIRGDTREMGSLTANVKNLNERVGRFEEVVKVRFNKVEARFDRIEDKIDKILPVIYRLEQKLDPSKLNELSIP